MCGGSGGHGADATPPSIRSPGILVRVGWLDAHQVLVAGLVLVALFLLGVVVLVVRAIGLVRAARDGMRRVDLPVQSISAGLSDAERRVETLTAGQGELTEALDRVGAHTGELRVLLDHAGRALSMLRAPFRYLGR
jgi:hypothetical protein